MRAWRNKWTFIVLGICFLHACDEPPPELAQVAKKPVGASKEVNARNLKSASEEDENNKLVIQNIKSNSYSSDELLDFVSNADYSQRIRALALEHLIRSKDLEDSQLEELIYLSLITRPQNISSSQKAFRSQRELRKDELLIVDDLDRALKWLGQNRPEGFIPLLMNDAIESNVVDRIGEYLKTSPDCLNDELTALLQTDSDELRFRIIELIGHRRFDDSIIATLSKRFEQQRLKIAPLSIDVEWTEEMKRIFQSLRSATEFESAFDVLVFGLYHPEYQSETVASLLTNPQISAPALIHQLGRISEMIEKGLYFSGDQIESDLWLLSVIEGTMSSNPELVNAFVVFCLDSLALSAPEIQLATSEILLRQIDLFTNRSAELLSVYWKLFEASSVDLPESRRQVVMAMGQTIEVWNLDCDKLLIHILKKESILLRATALESFFAYRMDFSVELKSLILSESQKSSLPDFYNAQLKLFLADFR